METISYDYFDESYYQEGSKRGTAYSNYREGARDSKTFQEIALAIQEIFQPKRVLDVGCATGAIVAQLNKIGCEAHGIDVSEWAVRHAEHPNVRLASADNLPYPDEFFDLVISCHSMEHLPDAVFEKSLAEIVRVSSAFQFHLLPMVGTPPYLGDPAEVRKILKKDPTHQQLFPKEWWIEQFEKRGCVALNTSVLLQNETSTAELSVGQFLLKKQASIDDSEVLRRTAVRNGRVFREVQLTKFAQARLPSLSPHAANRLSYRELIWQEVKQQLPKGKTIDLTRGIMRLVVIVEGCRPCSFRFAAGQDTDNDTFAHLGEFQFVAQPGCNTLSFTSNELRTMRGAPDYSAVNHLAFGGENEETEALFYITDDAGNPVLGRMPGAKPLQPPHFVLNNSAANHLNYQKRIWQDVERKLPPGRTLDLAGKDLRLVAMLQGKPCVLRFAAGQDGLKETYEHVGELHFSLEAGCNVFTFSADQLSTLRGSPDYSAVNHMGFGGEAEDADIRFYLSDEFGTPLLLARSA